MEYFQSERKMSTLKFYSQQKVFFKNEHKIMTSSEKQKPRKYVPSRLTLKETLKT